MADKKKKYREANPYFNNQKDIDLARKIAGLPPLKTSKRSCLKCDITFDSDGPFNRICESCRWINRDDEDDTYEIKKPK